jgi:hypothetical protein
MIKCSLCTQRFNELDLLVEEQKKRHVEFHKSTGFKRNVVIGKVEWIKIDEKDK